MSLEKPGGKTVVRNVIQVESAFDRQQDQIVEVFSRLLSEDILVDFLGLSEGISEDEKADTIREILVMYRNWIELAMEAIEDYGVSDNQEVGERTQEISVLEALTNPTMNIGFDAPAGFYLVYQALKHIRADFDEERLSALIATIFYKELTLKYSDSGSRMITESDMQNADTNANAFEQGQAIQPASVSDLMEADGLMKTLFTDIDPD